MAVEIVIPQVGEAVAEVTLVEWLKEVGDVVRKGETLFLVDTEKATIEVEAFVDGVLSEIKIPAGSPVMPQQVVGMLLEEGESVEDLPGVEKEITEGEGRRQETISPVAQRVADELGVDLKWVEGTGADGRITAEDVRRQASQAEAHEVSKSVRRSSRRKSVSPRAKRLAKEMGVDVSTIVGSGEGGMVTVADVEKAAQQVQPEFDLRGELKPFSKRRAAVARQMIASKDQVPHFYLMVDVDMSNVKQLRVNCVEEYGWERPPTFTDLIVRACALTLENMPSLNVQYSEQGVIQLSTVDIGVAVGLEDGLIVPVITQADQRNLKDISERIRKVSDRARRGRLHEGDLAPKSMVVSNLGMFGVDSFIAIIDLTDPMILAVGRVVDRVVPVESQAVIRPMCTLTLSIDHRVLDGVQGARFLDEVKAKLETAEELLE